MTNTNDKARANRIAVRPLNDGYVADFYKTHKKIATIMSDDIPAADWQKHDPELKATTKSQLREDFRAYCTDHAGDFGVEYDPADRRLDCNKRAARYLTDNDVFTDAADMIKIDVTRFMEKLPDATQIASWQTGMESITPMTKTSKGSDLSKMGITGGKYNKNNSWAWADIEGAVTLTTINGKEIYFPIKMQLVSGQLKKPHMTQTLWNTEIHKSLIEVGVIAADEEEKPAAKPDKPSKDTTKSGKSAAKSGKGAKGAKSKDTTKKTEKKTDK